MIELFDRLIIPAWAAPYLENGDASSLDENELTILRQFERNKLPVGPVFDWSDQTSFYHYNDVHLQGADCYEVAVYAPFPFQYYTGGA